MKLEFNCPACDSYSFEEVMINVTVISEIDSIDDEGEIDYGDQSNHDGEVSHYQCTGCGKPLPVEDVHDSESLPECIVGMKVDRDKDFQERLLESLCSAQVHLENHCVDLDDGREDQRAVKKLIAELGLQGEHISKYGYKH